MSRYSAKHPSTRTRSPSRLTCSGSPFSGFRQCTSPEQEDSPVWSGTASLKSTTVQIPNMSTGAQQTAGQLILGPRRPSRLFGKRFEFETSSLFGFSPNTFMRVVFQTDCEGFLRETGYEQWLALKSLGRSLESGSKMHRSSIDALRWTGPNPEPPFIRHSAHFSQDTLPPSTTTPWRILRQVIRSTEHEVIRRVLVRLAFYDRLGSHCLKLATESPDAPIGRLIVKHGLLHWQQAFPGIHPRAALCIEATLHHLAWFEAELERTAGARKPISVLEYVTPPTRPMRAWFNQLLEATKCENLVDLHHLLLKRDVRHLDRPISHDLLKKWSSSQVLIPKSAVNALLSLLDTDDKRDFHRLGLVIAKTLTLLVEAARCFSGADVTTAAAQRHLFDRLTQLKQEFGCRTSPYGSRLFPFGAAT